MKKMTKSDVKILADFCGGFEDNMLPVDDLTNENVLMEIADCEITAMEEDSLLMEYKGESIIVIPELLYDSEEDKEYRLLAFVTRPRRAGLKLAKHTPTWDEVLAEIKRQKRTFTSYEGYDFVLSAAPFKNWTWE